MQHARVSRQAHPSGSRVHLQVAAQLLYACVANRKRDISISISIGISVSISTSGT
jgi:hypothetical protein